MTTRQLHEAVARATGEEINTIAGRGFSLVHNTEPVLNDDWQSLAIDGDEFEVQRPADERRCAV